MAFTRWTWRTPALTLAPVWPQVNGVARTLGNVTDCLTRFGYQVSTITPGQFWTVPHPAYPGIRLAINTWPRLGRMVGTP